MFIYLILLFTVLPALELVLLIKVGMHIGALNTVLLVIVISIVGAYLTRLQGFLVLTKIQDQLNRGVMPNSELLDGALILAGGILLLTPGFITDFIGLILLIPLTRAMVKIFLKRKIKAMIEKGQVIQWTAGHSRRSKSYDDIDLN